MLKDGEAVRNCQLTADKVHELVGFFKSTCGELSISARRQEFSGNAD